MLTLGWLLLWVSSSQGSLLSRKLQPLPVANEVFPNAYLVQFKDTPVQKDSSQVNQDHRRFLHSMKKQNIGMSIRQTFTGSVFHGISVDINKDEDVKWIAEDENVKAIWPLGKVSVPASRQYGRIHPSHKKGSSHLRFAHTFTGVSNLQTSNPPLTGNGVKVAIVDGGIDYTHPDLGGCFGPNCKVAFGYDFVGDCTDNIPLPDNDPQDDTDGFGTHMAGIVGAISQEMNFVGVAPGATLGAYKIFGCQNGTTIDIVLKALEKAYEDGMNVIVLGFWDLSLWSDSPIAAAISNLADSGVITVAAQGDEESLGIMMAADPGKGKDALSVTSFDNSVITFNFFTFNNNEIPFIKLAQDTIAGGQEFDLKYGNTPSEGCEAFPSDSYFSGKTALLNQSSQCPLNIQVQNAMNAGAEAVIFVSVLSTNELSFYPGYQFPIPVMMISQQEGLLLLDNLDQGNIVVLVFQDYTRDIPISTSGQVSYFSSWGPGFEMEMKPDIGAPGGGIFSTFPVSMGSYELIHGTAMATAYLGGVVALLLEKYPTATVDDIRNRLLLSAKPENDSKWPEFKSSVLLQGSGLVQADKAINQDFSVTPSKVPLVFQTTKTQVFVLDNLDTNTPSRRFHISYQQALSVNAGDLNTINTCPVAARVTFSKTYLSVPTRGNATFAASMKSNPALDIEKDPYFFSGYIVVTEVDFYGNAMEQEVSIPFFGYNQNWLNRPVIFRDPQRKPQLILHTTSKDEVIDFEKNGDTVELQFSVALMSQRVELYVYDTKSDVSYEVASWTNIERDVPISWTWEGYFNDGSLAKGHYRFQLRALKIGFDPNSPGSYDQWLSEEFLVI